MEDNELGGHVARMGRGRVLVGRGNGQRPRRRRRSRWEYNIKIVNGGEPSGCMKCGEFLDNVRTR